MLFGACDRRSSALAPQLVAARATAGHFRTGAGQYGRRELAYRSLLLLVTGRNEKGASRGDFSKARRCVDQAAAISQEPFFRTGKAKKPITAKPESIIARVAGDAVVGL